MTTRTTSTAAAKWAAMPVDLSWDANTWQPLVIHYDGKPLPTKANADIVAILKGWGAKAHRGAKVWYFASDATKAAAAAIEELNNLSPAMVTAAIETPKQPKPAAAAKAATVDPTQSEDIAAMVQAAIANAMPSILAAAAANAAAAAPKPATRRRAAAK